MLQEAPPNFDAENLTESAASIAAATPPSSPAAIAAAVRKIDDHERLETELRELRASRQGILDQQRALIAAKTDGNIARTDRELTALSARILALEERIRTARAKVTPLRAAHATAVTKALAGCRREAARRALDASAELTRAARILVDADEEIVRAGGDRRWIRIPALGEIEAIARSILGLK